MNLFIQYYASIIKNPLNIVDVGSSGGCREVNLLSKISNVYAIDPRPKIYSQDFNKFQNFSLGLFRVETTRKLFITNDPRASSIYEPNQSVIGLWRTDDAFNLEKIEDIECTTLDLLMRKSDVYNIDLLKLDTQGSELDILLGAHDYISKVSIIKIEVSFIEIYKGQKLFDEVHTYLVGKKFKFLMFFDGHYQYLPNEKVKKPIWADAFFIRTDLDEQSILKSIAIFVDQGYYTEAKYLEKNYLNSNEIYNNFIEAKFRCENPRSYLILNILIKRFRKFFIFIYRTFYSNTALNYIIGKSSKNKKLGSYLYLVQMRLKRFQ